MQPDSFRGNWDQGEGPNLLFKKSKVITSWQQHLIECAKHFLGAFSLEEAKTRVFLCCRGFSLGEYHSKVFHQPVTSQSLPWLLGQWQSWLHWTKMLLCHLCYQPTLRAPILEISFFWGDALALTPFQGAASKEVCSEMKIIDLMRVSHGTAAPFHYHEQPNPSRREKREFFWLGILSAHAWGTPAECCCPNPPGRDQAAHGIM